MLFAHHNQQQQQQIITSEKLTKEKPIVLIRVPSFVVCTLFQSSVLS